MSITIVLNNCQVAGSVVSVSLPGGAGQFVLALSQGIAIDGAPGFQSLAVKQAEVALGIPPGTVFDGQLVLDVQATQPGTPPVVLLNGLSSGVATVSYPTNSGPATQLLTPGDPLALTGFVSI